MVQELTVPSFLPKLPKLPKEGPGLQLYRLSVKMALWSSRA